MTLIHSASPIEPTGVPSWDSYFLDVCDAISRRSKDPNTKLGAVIVGPAHEIRSTGYNSLPRRIRDDVPERFERPEKYLWIEHAERNAILNAARVGIPTDGCTIYQQILPCMDCARAIIQAGIKRIVLRKEAVERYMSERYTPEFERVGVLLTEAGVEIQAV